MRDKRVINIVGNILMLLSLAFIVNRIIEYRIDFSSIFSIWPLIILAISIITYALVVIALANIFYVLLKLFGNREISKYNSILIYCKSNLYKYLPGNIFHYVGRNQIAINEGASHGAVIAATIAEILLLTLAAVITAITFAGQYAVSLLLDSFTIKVILILLILIVLVILAAIILYKVNSRVREWVIGNTNQINRIRFTIAIKFIMAYIINFILNGVMFIMVLYSIGGEISNNLIVPVIGMYTLSWIIGFVTPGVPAGLGIREVIMSAMLIGVVDPELVIIAVVLYRIVTIMGDVVAFIIAHQLRRILSCHHFLISSRFS